MDVPVAIVAVSTVGPNRKSVWCVSPQDLPMDRLRAQHGSGGEGTGLGAGVGWAGDYERRCELDDSREVVVCLSFACRASALFVVVVALTMTR